MISVKEAAAQVKRLYQLRGYPKGEDGKEARQDLFEELRKVESLGRAEEIVNSFLDNATGESMCPTCSEIRKAVRSNLEEMRPDPGCPKCNGEGWEHIERNGLSALGAKCRCWARRPAPKIPPLEDGPALMNRPATSLTRIKERHAIGVLETLAGKPE